MKKSFENCTWSELNNLFGLQKLKALPALQTWLDAPNSIAPETEHVLQKLQASLVDNFMDWNEDELKMQFIAPLLYLVDYNDNDKYHAFSQRPIQMQTESIELSGVVDWVLASGKQFPEEPYFFLNEYKKEKGTNADPVGQVLAAMLTAQYLNADKQKIIYGAYVVGKDWYFIALHEKTYAHSLPCSTTDFHVLQKIYNVLTYLKKLL